MSSLGLNSSLGIFKVNVKVETKAKYQLSPKTYFSWKILRDLFFFLLKSSLSGFFPLSAMQGKNFDMIHTQFEIIFKDSVFFLSFSSPIGLYLN